LVIGRVRNQKDMGATSVKTLTEPKHATGAANKGERGIRKHNRNLRESRGRMGICRWRHGDGCSEMLIWGGEDSGVTKKYKIGRLRGEMIEKGDC